MVAQGLQAAVEAGRLFGGVLGGGDGEEQPGKVQCDAFCHMAGHTEGIDDPAPAGAVKVEELLLEPTPDAFHHEVDTHADDGQAQRAEDHGAEGAAEQGRADVLR